MAHKSGICKEPGCGKEQWKDGWCRTCIQYVMQKQTISGLENLTSLLVKTIDSIQTLEVTISNSKVIDINSQSKLINSEVLSPIIKHIDINKNSISKKTIDNEDQPVFIPSIEINTSKSLIRDTQTTVINKNINDIVKKLGHAQLGDKLYGNRR